MLRVLLASLALALTSAVHAQGVSDNSIVIGQSAPLSGPAAQLGVDINFGANLYFYEVNRRGGVNGRKIRLRVLDDGYEPQRTVANTKRLIEEDKVFALFGYIGAPTSEAALPIATSAGVPFLSPFSGAESLRNYNRVLFNTRASYYDETEAIVRHLTTLGLTRIAAFYENDESGQGGLAGVERALKQRKLELVARGTVERNGIDVAQAVREITAAKPQAVVMMAAYTGSVAFIREMQKQDVAPSLWNVSFVGSQVLARELDESGRGVQVSQVVPFPWDTNLAVVRDYQKVLTEVKGAPGFGSLEGYIAARALVEGLRRAGPQPTRESFIKALETLRNYDMGGYSVSFGPNEHNGSRFVDLTMITREQRFLR
ncbi:ABC transporter substrate-binding protein [Niveibacterium sp. SC-1]|uniref:ABC transporter substrate-binding protein n=1 Tax=Niveibacterium sp. SC-1 TaxID=3135646 RepID=UPI00311D78AA